MRTDVVLVKERFFSHHHPICCTIFMTWLRSLQIVVMFRIVSSWLKLKIKYVSSLSVLNYGRSSMSSGLIGGINISCDGLLNGATSNFYTSNLNLDQSKSMIRDFDQRIRIALAKDYVGLDNGQVLGKLKEIEKSVSVYLSGGVICGREKIVKLLESLFLQCGHLVFVTGSGSCGKSLIVRSVLENIQKEMQMNGGNRVGSVLVDGRSGSRILPAIQEATATGGFSFNMSGVDLTKCALAEAVAQISEYRPDVEHNVLVLDEADQYLKTSDDPIKRAEVRSLFQSLVKQTKQERLMTAAMVSSDCDLPEYLAENYLSINNITHMLVVGEASPQAVLDALQKKMGVGAHLSHELVSIYGGNILYIAHTLRSLTLATEGERHIPHTNPMHFVMLALAAWKDQGGRYSEIADVLKEVARVGFYQVPFTIPVARVLVEHKVCGYLSRGDFVFHVSPHVRANSVSGLKVI